MSRSMTAMSSPSVRGRSRRATVLCAALRPALRGISGCPAGHCADQLRQPREPAALAAQAPAATWVIAAARAWTPAATPSRTSPAGQAETRQHPAVRGDCHDRRPAHPHCIDATADAGNRRGHRHRRRVTRGSLLGPPPVAGGPYRSCQHQPSRNGHKPAPARAAPGVGLVLGPAPATTAAQFPYGASPFSRPPEPQACPRRPARGGSPPPTAPATGPEAARRLLARLAAGAGGRCGS